MFSIDCLEVLEECDSSLYKNLRLREKYFFNNRYNENFSAVNVDSLFEKVPDFWGKNINVQAIVGKNGSGKSTLMDLLFAAINNFSYLFERGNKRKRPGAEEMFFISGLNVDLHFSMNKATYVLHCDNDGVILKKNKSEILNLKLDIPGCNRTELPYTRRYIDDADLASLLKDFFYTIVSNYSMQSFVNENYKRKIYFYADDKDLSRIDDKRERVNHDCLSFNELSWINPIFHKNDGYIRSIVLNPFRNNGRINLSNEFELSKERVASLYISTEISDLPKRRFFHPYKFCCIKTIRNQNNIEKYIDNALRSNESIDNPRPLLTDSLITNFIRKTDDFSTQIINVFNLPKMYEEEKKANLLCGIAYIKVKIFKIIQKYPSYQEFKDVLTIKYDDGNVSIVGEFQKVEKLLTFVKTDSSHITKKIRRFVNFLTLDDGKLPERLSLDYIKKKYDNQSVFWHPLEEEPVELKPTFSERCLSPQLFDDCLPPPLYDWKLILNKVDEKKILIKVDKDESGNVYRKDNDGNYTKNGEFIDFNLIPNVEISYNQLSSGEIQFLQTISIHVYHLMNLISVQKNGTRPKYKNFNLVFDELEVCFHPEMQRIFLKKFLNVLTDLDIGDNFVNIIIITHSPFILSDIPSSNILFLSDGRPNKKIRRTFAENICEMMYDSFFMDSTIGAFAEEKIKKAVKYRQEKNPETDDSPKKKEYDAIVESIGDSVIRSLIEEVEIVDTNQENGAQEDGAFVEDV